MNQLSRFATILSLSLQSVDVSDIGLYEAVCEDSLFGFSIGTTIECFHVVGTTPDFHTSLNSLRIADKLDFGIFFIMAYEISSSPGDVFFLHCLSALNNSCFSKGSLIRSSSEECSVFRSSFCLSSILRALRSDGRFASMRSIWCLMVIYRSYPAYSCSALATEPSWDRMRKIS